MTSFADAGQPAPDHASSPLRSRAGESATRHDLWLRPGLALRDRSLVTISALIANGQVAQIPFHLNRAMNNGLTKPQASEVITHVAFYAGWPNAFSAVPVVKGVFESRSK
jgi:4-carboxymuconolactone decarboxylase